MVPTSPATADRLRSRCHSFDRDEYPPAVGRGAGRGWSEAATRGWRADVRYVPSGENRFHGASLGNQLESFCDGTRFRYVFR